MRDQYKFLSDEKVSKLSSLSRLSKYGHPERLPPKPTENKYIFTKNTDSLAGSITFPIQTPIVPETLLRFLNYLNSCYTSVTDVVPRIVYFADEPDNNSGPYTNIGDACNDMYDGGNLYNTNLTQLYINIEEDEVDRDLSIPYTHTQATQAEEGNCDYTDPPMDGLLVEDQSYFGEDSKYFTNMYPGMFIMAASNVNITEFSITGDIGSDGYGIDNVYVGTSDYPEWTIFTKTNQDEYGDDPSINHIIAVYGDVSGVTQLHDNGSRYDDHCLQGLTSDNSVIICAVVATEGGTEALTYQEALIIGNKLIGIYKIGC